MEQGGKRVKHLLRSFGDTGIAQLPEGNMCVFGVLEEGACCTVGGLWALAQPLLAILPVLGKLRKLHLVGPRSALHEAGGTAHAMRGAMERLDVLCGRLVRKGILKEFRSSQGLGQSEWSSMAFCDAGH